MKILHQPKWLTPAVELSQHQQHKQVQCSQDGAPSTDDPHIPVLDDDDEEPQRATHHDSSTGAVQRGHLLVHAWVPDLDLPASPQRTSPLSPQRSEGVVL
jgi:hypothetical protein